MQKKNLKLLITLTVISLIILFVVIGLIILGIVNEKEDSAGSENNTIVVEENGDDNDDSVAIEGMTDISDTEKKDTDSEDSSEKEDSSETVTGSQNLLTAEGAQALVQSKADGTYAEDKAFAAGKITCDETATFSGQFVEDGRDELVENVAAIRVTNRSEEYLDFATLIYDVNGQTATFVVTGLPAGRTAWVLEKSRMMIDNESNFVYQSSTTSFKENVETSSDLIEVTSDGNMLTATNTSEKEMENIVVYYKVLHDDGYFLGGITYVVDFGSVKAGESKETLAGHYMEGKSEIVRIDWQEK